MTQDQLNAIADVWQKTFQRVEKAITLPAGYPTHMVKYAHHIACTSDSAVYETTVSHISTNTEVFKQTLTSPNLLQLIKHIETFYGIKIPE